MTFKSCDSRIGCDGVMQAYEQATALVYVLEVMMGHGRHPLQAPGRELEFLD